MMTLMKPQFYVYLLLYYLGMDILRMKVFDKIGAEINWPNSIMNDLSLLYDDEIIKTTSAFYTRQN